MTVHDILGAFVAHGRVEREGKPGGPLSGLTFAVKDLFDVAGVPTGAGSPDWLGSHGVPTASAPIVDLLLDAGARLIGKSHTDEIAWSLNGENHHYGTPINPAAPERIPGGSSSGSASAVAGGLVDFAVGSDTGGSVRLPASFCGIFGMRPTHGRIPIDGAVPLAPSYDSVGWFTRDGALFARVGAAILGSSGPASRKPRVMIADDMFAAAGTAVSEALSGGIARLLSIGNNAAEHVDVGGGALPQWRNAFRLIQSAEAWAAHREWIGATRPSFGPGVRERFEAAAKLDPAEVAAARALRGDIRARMDDLLGEDGLLLLPTAPGIAPIRGTPAADLEAFRARSLELLCPAGHAGLPQISLPFGQLEGCPVGLSVIAPRGRDEMLLEIAGAI